MHSSLDNASLDKGNPNVLRKCFFHDFLRLLFVLAQTSRGIYTMPHDQRESVLCRFEGQLYACGLPATLQIIMLMGLE